MWEASRDIRMLLNRALDLIRGEWGDITFPPEKANHALHGGPLVSSITVP